MTRFLKYLETIFWNDLYYLLGMAIATPLATLVVIAWLS